MAQLLELELTRESLQMLAAEREISLLRDPAHTCATTSPNAKKRTTAPVSSSHTIRARDQRAYFAVSRHQGDHPRT
jgi:hypothetical protein